MIIVKELGSQFETVPTVQIPHSAEGVCVVHAVVFCSCFAVHERTSSLALLMSSPRWLSLKVALGGKCTSSSFTYLYDG